MNRGRPVNAPFSYRGFVEIAVLLKLCEHKKVFSLQSPQVWVITVSLGYMVLLYVHNVCVCVCACVCVCVCVY